MKNIDENNEKLNQEKLFKIKDIIKWLLSTYYKSTGIKVFFIDRKGQLFLSSTSDYIFCDFCGLIQNSWVGKNKCVKSFRDGANKSYEYGFPYIYRCHSGIIEWVAPFNYEGRWLGSFVSGGVLMRKPDLFF